MNTKPKKSQLVVPLLIIAFGTAWLLNVYQVVPGVDWMWTGGLAVFGIIALALGGLNRHTVIVGPFLMIGSLLSILRQTGRLDLNVELPILFIAFGVLLLASYILPLPPPAYLVKEDDDVKR